MLSTQFHEKFDNFPFLKKYFDGTFASDTLPKSIKKDHFIICNTDTSNGPGKHWYCIIKSTPSSLECFDSLGVDETKKEFLKANFKQKNVEEIKFNVTSLQPDDSISCGQFVLYFIIQRSHNKDLSFSNLLNDIFTISKETNEELVLNFFRDHLQNGTDKT